MPATGRGGTIAAATEGAAEPIAADCCSGGTLAWGVAAGALRACATRGLGDGFCNGGGGGSLGAGTASSTGEGGSLGAGWESSACGGGGGTGVSVACGTGGGGGSGAGVSSLWSVAAGAALSVPGGAASATDGTSAGAGSNTSAMVDSGGMAGGSVRPGRNRIAVSRTRGMREQRQTDGRKRQALRAAFARPHGVPLLARPCRKLVRMPVECVPTSRTIRAGMRQPPAHFWLQWLNNSLPMENTAPALTSTSFTMQLRPVLSVNLTS